MIPGPRWTWTDYAVVALIVLLVALAIAAALLGPKGGHPYQPR